MVDRLLNSPHYGERRGRHWLDVARYSEGTGGDFDDRNLPLPRPGAIVIGWSGLQS